MPVTKVREREGLLLRSLTAQFLSLFLVGAVFLSVFTTASFAREEKTVTPLRIGAEFPDFVLPDADGRAVSLDDFRGKAILLSFWSCHTDTCYTSVRVIEALLGEYGSLGLVAPTVCSEVPPALEKNSYAGLLERCGTGQVVLIDKDQALTERLGITEFPTTYLIDRNYTVWEVIEGVPPLMGEEFGAMVRSLVNE
jgi:peroxiredoxin